MTDFNLKFDILKEQIDNMNQTIVRLLHAEQYNEINEILNKRYDLLTELVSAVSTRADKELLVPYLNEFQKLDILFMEAVTKEKNQISNVLHNLNNLLDYTNV
jgi:hypothetical protein